LVLSAPSGAGKTSIAKALVRGWEDCVFSVSATTRPAREHETEGLHYHFVDESDFKAMLDAGQLLESAEVHGYMYGTLKSALDDARRRGQHLILDIDVQGAMQLRTRVSDAVLVFVLPPSAETLVERLRGRGTEDDEIVGRRLRNARGELERALDFDHVVVNDDLDRAVAEVGAITLGEATPDPRAIDLSDTIRELQRRIDEILAEGFISAPS
jgi:guanylate kinase